MKSRVPLLFGVLLMGIACQLSTPVPPPASPTPSPVPTPPDRLASIPKEAVKMTPAEDRWPPQAAAGWSQPRPLGPPINTAGGEDSPFITPDGGQMYFFFTPDVSIPAEQQLNDGVTGIWVSQREGDAWGDPQRVTLAPAGILHLDGCEFVLGDWMIFCSAREGNFRGVDMYTATFQDGVWTDVQNMGKLLNVDYQIGELHVTPDRQFLYFSTVREDGLGGSDLWVSRWNGTEWGEPRNLGAPVNSPGDEGRPFVSPDGQDLWFDGTSRSGSPGPSVFLSHCQPDGSWGPPEEIITSFGAEPTLDARGHTLYFVHHYYNPETSQMIEADIYFSDRLDH